MVKIPKSLIVDRETYPIYTSDHILDCGYTDIEKKKIVINSKMSMKDIQKTFIHEVMHALDQEYEIKLKHWQVYKLEKALYYFLLDNDLVIETNKEP